MSIEAIFRGKCEDTKEWVCGYYIPFGEGNNVRSAIITEPPTGFFTPIYIDEKTRGMFTGLTDMNDKMIFEGDIIRHYNSNCYEDQYEVGVVYWNSDGCAFRRTRGVVGADPVLLHKTCRYEVIGNVFDNPELLRGIRCV